VNLLPYVEIAGDLPGPAWLRDLRVAAARRGVELGVPSSEEEAWRYSPIRDLDLESRAPSTATGGAAALPGELVDSIGDRAATVVLDNGRITSVEVDPLLEAKGVRVVRVADTDESELLATVTAGASDLFAELSAALAPEPLLIDIPAGVVVEAPVVIASGASAPDAAVYTRVIVRAGENSEVRVADLRTSAPVGQLVVPHVDLVVGPSARLGYVEVQEHARTTWQIGQQVSRVAQAGQLRSVVAAFGGAYARLRTECRLDGRGASGDLLAAYFADGDQTLDFRTFQQHVAPDTTSNLLYVGVGAGTSRSVYTGTIRVEHEARGTDAVQTNRNVKLSDEAWAESVPNLEIYNNEVKCAHASAVGPVDEEQRFYLESRGVPPEVAERLIVAGFFEAVLAKLPVPALEAPLRADIDDKLDQRER